MPIKYRLSRIMRSEEGMALAFALLILMILAVAALSSIMVTNTGLAVTREFKVHQEVMYIADAGAEYSLGFVSRTMGNGMAIDAIDTASDVIIADSADLLEELSGGSDNGDSYTDAAPDLQFDIGNGKINIDVDYFRADTLEGCADEYASKYEGIGSGTGCTSIYYQIDSQMVSTSATEDSTAVRVHFRCVESGGRCL